MLYLLKCNKTDLTRDKPKNLFMVTAALNQRVNGIASAAKLSTSFKMLVIFCALFYNQTTLAGTFADIRVTGIVSDQSGR